MGYITSTSGMVLLARNRGADVEIEGTTVSIEETVMAGVNVVCNVKRWYSATKSLNSRKFPILFKTRSNQYYLASISKKIPVKSKTF